MKTVYPVYRGNYVVHAQGVPAIEQTVSDKDAEALVATGAFTYEKPPDRSEPTTEPKTRQDGGSSDSKE
jgi:hypothetical protein